jgi:hypothetical protein
LGQVPAFYWAQFGQNAGFGCLANCFNLLPKLPFKDIATKEQRYVELYVLLSDGHYIAVASGNAGIIIFEAAIYWI